MKIAIYSCHHFEMSYLEAALSVKHQLVNIEQELSEDSAALAASCQAVALFTSDKADTPVLKKLYDLGIRYILLRSAGYDHVDLASAGKLGLRIANVPDYSPYAVAEHAVALLMALNRKLIASQKLVALNDFRLDGLTGYDVHNKTVGIIGMGRIGEVFARIMKGFGCTVLCYDPWPRLDLETYLNVHFTTLTDLLRQSDIISVHCPLNMITNHLLNRETFGIMKKGVVIINTSRGAVINTTDLFEALDSGIIGALGLDVYEFEKGLFFADHSNDGHRDPLLDRLLTYSNVMVTGHQAFLTETALKNIANTVADNLNAFESGKTCHNELISDTSLGIQAHDAPKANTVKS